MNYLTQSEGIKILLNFLLMENIIPVFGAGFSGNMPCRSGVVPMGAECTKRINDILKEYSSLSEESIDNQEFPKATKRFWKEIEKNNIPENIYVGFFRDNFTDVKLDNIRTDVLRLPWKNVYTINIDDGIENTGLYTTILPYKNVREDSSRKDRVFKLHGDAKHEVEYKNKENIIFNEKQYKLSMDSEENQTIRNNILTAYRDFNIIYIGCSLEHEPDLELYYATAKKDKGKTRIFYLTKNEISDEKEEDLEEYGVTDIIKVCDYDSFYIDLVYEYNNIDKNDLDYPYVNPIVKIQDEDRDYKNIYGINSFSEKNNRFIRSDILIDRSVYKDIEDAFKRNRVVVLYGRRFSGRTSLISQICDHEKTREIFYFPSTTAFDFEIVKDIISKKQQLLLLFDSNSMQPDVYTGMRELSGIINQNDHHILIIEPLEDTYLTESIDCEVLGLKPRLDSIELQRLNENLDKYGLIRRNIQDTNLDYLTRLKNEQKIDFPKEFKIPDGLSKVEKQLLILLAAQDKVYSRDLYMIGVNESVLKSIIAHTGKLCEKVKTKKGESKAQSVFKVVHNSRAMVIYLLKNYTDKIDDEVAGNIKELVQKFYQSKDRMQKQIAISIMQFDTLNEIYGGNRGAGKLIERVYEELQSVLNKDPHYWLQRSKSVYRMNPGNADKLKEAYQYCVKASDDKERMNSKLEAQTSLTLSLISGLLYRLTSGDEAVSYAETCIVNGYNAMKSDYYSLQHRERLEKERIGSRQTYEDLCKEICEKYISNGVSNNADLLEHISLAIDILKMLGS